MEGKFGEHFVQDSDDLLCSKDVGAVAENDPATMAEDALSVTEGQAEEIGIKDGLE